MKWHKFDYDNKEKTAPEAHKSVWINEEFYVNGVTTGYFDGFTFRMDGGSDDCSVTHWAEIVYPKGPRKSK